MAVKGPSSGARTAKPAKAAKLTPSDKDPQTTAAKLGKAAKPAAGSSDAHEELSQPDKPLLQTGRGETATAAAASRGRKRHRQPAETDLSAEEMARRAHQRKRRVRTFSTARCICPGVCPVYKTKL